MGDDPSPPENVEMIVNDNDDDESANREKLHFFSDGERRIDMILAYNDDHENNPDKKEMFDYYLNNLKEEFGLDTEVAEGIKRPTDYGAIEGEVTVETPSNNDVQFIKVHAPINVLYDHAEELKMKMPTTKNNIVMKTWWEESSVCRFLNRINPFRLRKPETKEAPNFFVATFDKDRLPEFHSHDNDEKFFTPAERGRLVSYLLHKGRHADGSSGIGIENLIHKGVFLDAFPLHDGPPLRKNQTKPENERQRLQKDWGSFKCIFKYQPIDAIREYFGEKIALYFAWLGFYTTFLIPAAIVGICCFIYGVVNSNESPVTKEACSDPKKNGTHLFYMCPLCDQACSYFLLKTNCLYAKATHWFDNFATLFFAIFMSIWATIFLEFWKRKDMSLSYEWHSIGYQDNEQQVRPEFEATAPIWKPNPVTGCQEPRFPRGQRCRRMSGTVGIVLFFLFLVLVCVVGVIIFRAFISVALLASSDKRIRERSKVIKAVLAGCLNLVAINILKQIYNRVAVVLTDWENPRTKTDYETSFTIKMFLFQFCNTYSSIVYVAFFKTEAITGSPGQYKRFGQSRFRLDGCSAQGCFLELTIQLIIIMVGQQFISNFFEMLLPTALKWWKDRKEKMRAKSAGYVEMEQHQWVDDYEGEMQTKFSLFWEYLEIVLQYGFVTMFVAAFPLAPFFALLNNILEIRVDACNYIHNFRRPIAQRAENIGAWYGILATLTSISVLVNAFVLAFTSELIPTLVYRYHFSKTGTMEGYLDWSLSTFQVKDFQKESRPRNATANGVPVQSYCRYPGFHNPTWPYARSSTYWMVMSARLAFVLAFVCFVFFVSWLVGYVINDVPTTLKLKMKREKYLTAQADKEHRKKRKKDQ